jgi:hypothetical protein
MKMFTLYGAFEGRITHTLIIQLLCTNQILENSSPERRRKYCHLYICELPHGCVAEGVRTPAAERKGGVYGSFRADEASVGATLRRRGRHATPLETPMSFRTTHHKHKRNTAKMTEFPKEMRPLIFSLINKDLLRTFL